MSRIFAIPTSANFLLYLLNDAKEIVMKLHGLVALVTGASRGIGRAIALRLAKDGATVVVHYGRNQDAANEIIQSITSTGGTAFPVQAELDTLKGVYALYDVLDAALIEQTGTTQFDILVNNAGIYPRATIENTTEEMFDRQFAVNVKAPFFLIQQALPRLRDGGRIINLSSAVTRFDRFLVYQRRGCESGTVRAGDGVLI
jgi:NAD(P)-dependent dehydrogenase (short-subunit alcohol dehydrogenase family)